VTIRYSNASATQVLVYALQPGEQVGADTLTLPALALGADDDVFIVEGSPEDLVAFAERVRAAARRTAPVAATTRLSTQKRKGSS
jgi:hypothetical protein